VSAFQIHSVYVCIYVCMYVCVCVYTYTHTHTAVFFPIVRYSCETEIHEFQVSEKNTLRKLFGNKEV